jgi:hypothetical protein
MRDIIHSTAATTQVGQLLIRAFDRGYTRYPSRVSIAKLPCIPCARTIASLHDAPPARRSPATDTLSSATHSGTWQRSQRGMSGSRRSRQSGGVEHVQTALLAHNGLLPGGANGGFELAGLVEDGLQSWHAEGAALDTDSVLQSLRFEGDEHELDALGPTAMQGRQHRVDLVSEQSDDDEVIGRLLVQRVSYPHACPLPLDVDDPIVALQLLKPGGASPRDNGDIVIASASQPEGKCATDFTNAKDGDT